MSKQKNKKKLVPKLRFPEFRDTGEWVERKLGEITTRVTKKNKKGIKYPIYSINNTVGFLPQNDQFEGVDSNTRGYDIKLYKIIEKNTFAYNPARINVGSIGYSGELHNIIISSLYVCFKTKKEIEDKFLQVFLGTFNFSQSVKDNVEGGIRSYLFYENFSRIKIPLPPQSDEQQKIADCFSSLNDLFTSEAAKLEVLKAHKKGLMQKLFPTEGNTVPECRFSEFLNTGEWDKKTINQISKNVIAGGTPSTLVTKYWDGHIRWMNSGELNLKKVYEVQGRITEEGLQNSSTKLIPKQCVLIGLAGQGKTRGTVAINMVELCTNQSIAAIFPNDAIFESNFLYHNLDHRYDELRRLSTGSEGRGGLNLQIIKSLVVKLPSIPEQQKIADCLSSLDELITAQEQKIEALKAHKKGLMQGLFPSTEDDA